MTAAAAVKHSSKGKNINIDAKKKKKQKARSLAVVCCMYVSVCDFYRKLKPRLAQRLMFLLGASEKGSRALGRPCRCWFAASVATTVSHYDNC